MEELNKVSESELNSLEKPHYLVSSWRGLEPLWKVYWLNFVLVGICIGRIGEGLVGSQSLIFLCLYLVLAIAFYTWSITCIWRCSFNTSSKIWGYLARFVSIVGPLATLVFG